MGDFLPSKYQQDIFDTIDEHYRQEQRFSLLISAVAGSGKSTTLRETLAHIPPDRKVVFLTFGHDINEDQSLKVKNYLKDRKRQKLPAPKASCMTLHALGSHCLHRMDIHGNPEKGKRKYNRLCQAYLKTALGDSYSYPLSLQLKALIDKVRVTLSEPTEDNLIQLLRRFTDIDIQPEDKEIWPVVMNAIPSILRQGIELAKVKGTPELDFTDQIWLPSSRAMNLQTLQYDVVLIDEAQDLSPCQRELVMKACKPSGIKIYVGDRDQSIYAFAGASLHSIDEIKDAEQPNVTELPLSICYRCPTEVIKFAAQLRPGIEPSPDAPAGRIEQIHNDQVVELAEPGDLILCRLNAPLVKMCLRLLRSGKRATVRGMDLGERFEGLIEQIGKKYPGFSQNMVYGKLTTCAQDYASSEVEILRENEEENEERILQLEDNIATLLALYEAHRRGATFPNHMQPFPLDFNGFLAFINHFFEEDKGAQIILSTGHKAKGLEFPVVFILSWNRLPLSRATTEDAQKQERNLMYVMTTRCLFDTKNPRSGILYLGYDGDPNEEVDREVEDFSSDIVEASSTSTSVTEMSMHQNTEDQYIPENTFSVYEDNHDIQPREAVVRLPGRPKKGKGRIRMNVSFDVDVAGFLRTQEDISNFLEKFVLELSEFTAYLAEHANDDSDGDGEKEGGEESETEIAAQLAVKVVTISCPECGQQLISPNGTFLIDAPAWEELPDMLICSSCETSVKRPTRNPFGNGKKRKKATV